MFEQGEGVLEWRGRHAALERECRSSLGHSRDGAVPMRRWKCFLACVVPLLLACAGGTDVVRKGATGDVAPVEGSVFVEWDAGEGDGSPPGAFLPEGWEHQVWGAGTDSLDGAVAMRPSVRRGGARSVRQPPLLATPRPTPVQAHVRAQRTANHAGYENHHLIPMYLGGAKTGQTYRLPTAYHKAITQAFRREWPYGRRKPDQEALTNILVQVYAQYPIPQLIGITP